LADLMAPGDRKGTKADYEWNGVRPRAGRHWSYTLAKMKELDRDGRILWNSRGVPKLKMFLDESRGVPLSNSPSSATQPRPPLRATGCFSSTSTVLSRFRVTCGCMAASPVAWSMSAAWTRRLPGPTSPAS
jgi:hypothetical protein